MATQYTAGLTTGQVLTSATMNSIGAVSETFTPLWSSTGTQPAIGNGTLTGRYFRIQKMIFVEMFFQPGSTSTYGTGTYKFSIPVVARTGIFGFMSTGVARLYDASVGTVVFGQTGFQNSETDRCMVYLATGTPLGQTVPFTWATADELIMSFQYEAA